MLTIMALVLMGRLILTVNRTTLDTGFTKDLSEYRITGTSLGTSMLEKASNLAFDETTVEAQISLTSSLTASASMGPDAGETTETLYDDIDDYNNYTITEAISGSAIFKTKVTVQYVQVASNVITTTSTKTFSKLLSVDITSDYLIDYSVNPPRPDTLRFQQIFSYWYFR